MSYGGPYNYERRVSASSMILLAVFVAAALVMVAIVVWKPLVHDSSTPAFSDQAALAQPVAISAAATPEVSAP